MKILENPLVPVLTPDSPFPTFTSKVFPFHSQFSPFHSQFSLSFLTFPLLFPIFPLPFPVFRFLSHFPDFPVPISRSEPHKRRRNPGINERKNRDLLPTLELGHGDALRDGNSGLGKRWKNLWNCGGGSGLCHPPREIFQEFGSNSIILFP